MLQSEGLILNSSIQSSIHRVSNPGKTGGNQLLPLHCETIPLSCAKTRRYELYVRRRPRLAMLTGVFVMVRMAWAVCKMRL
jgi:hypothetical protein